MHGDIINRIQPTTGGGERVGPVELGANKASSCTRQQSGVWAGVGALSRDNSLPAK